MTPYLAARLVEGAVGFTLLLAGAGKLSDLRGYRDLLESLSRHLRARHLGVMLAVAEVLVGAAMFLGLAPAVADSAGALFACAFVLAQRTRRAAEDDCGCLGIFDRNMSTRVAHGRALAVLTLCLAALSLRVVGGQFGFAVAPSRLLVGAIGGGFSIVALLGVAAVMQHASRSAQLAVSGPAKQ